MSNQPIEHISQTLDRVALHLVETFRDVHRVETVLQAVNRSYRDVTALSAKTEQVAALIEQHAREQLLELSAKNPAVASSSL